MAVTGKNLPAFIMSILTPAISGVDNIWMFMGIYLFSNILWLFGINGSSIVFPIVFALCIANTGVNAELVNAGKIIRPAYKYVGHHANFVPFEEREPEEGCEEVLRDLEKESPEQPEEQAETIEKEAPQDSTECPEEKK